MSSGLSDEDWDKLYGDKIEEVISHWSKTLKSDKLNEKDRIRDEIIKLRKLLKELGARWEKMPAEGGETDENTNNSNHTVPDRVSTH